MTGRYQLTAAFVLLVFVCLASPAKAQTDLTPPSLPTWALPTDPSFRAVRTDEPQQLPGSSQAFSSKQAGNLFFSPDWHPDNHPPMPAIVSSGRDPVWACGSCHRAEGTGGPENASLAGQPESYIIQQMADFKSGARVTPNSGMMLAAQAITDEETRAAAAYFSALSWKPLIKVVESETVPKNYIAGFLFARDPQGGEEPLGRRIVEMPDDIRQFELRDSKSTFTAYVPVGSISKGEALAKTGGDGSTACTVCHGQGLTGLGPVPGIAGRSPTYLFRQLFYFKHGIRAGLSSPLMTPQVDRLSMDDMIALSAYLASLSP